LKVKTVDSRLLKSLSGDAKRCPRLRMNYNLHDFLDDSCQRRINAIEPGTYVRPHRHNNPPKAEAFIALSGRMSVLLFGDEVRVTETFLLDPKEGFIGVDVPAGMWHTILSHTMSSPLGLLLKRGQLQEAFSKSSKKDRFDEPPGI